MKLYFAPGSCSLCPHIVLREAGANFELEQVNVGEKKLMDGTDYWGTAPKGQVPVLVLDDGQALTECAAIIQYIADRNPGKGLAPVAGTMERIRLQEWLSFIGSELHKNLPPLFLPTTPEDYKPVALKQIEQKFGDLDRRLADNDYLMGKAFTVADAYCFAIVSWHKRADIDLAPWPHLAAFMARIGERAAVKEALAAEG